MVTPKFLFHIFPFLDWFTDYSSRDLYHDLVGGLTVALVLIPQSMAYAQLAGLPPYYGLYAALLPPIVASLFGSSRQLATGPVAIVSLMTATALEPLATAGSESFICYAILLALLVGAFQFLLGFIRLGLVVNFLSHPVISGFTNAAALIIASSQLSKIFGVHVDSAEHHYETIYNVMKEAVSYTHWPTLVLAVLAFATMIILRRINPRIPNVLIAVLITTIISWAIGFEHKVRIDISQIRSEEIRHLIANYNDTMASIIEKSDKRVSLINISDSLARVRGGNDIFVLNSKHKLNLLNLEINDLNKQARAYRSNLRKYVFIENTDSSGGNYYVPDTLISSGIKANCRNWCLTVGNGSLKMNSLDLSCGGAVVGTIPEGLPELKFPKVDFSIALSLLPMAVIISLLGFMEAISIAKAMASKTGQRLDVNRELMGQGLANIVGAFGQSYAVSGSFSRSAVNLQAGAKTGLSNVISSIVIVVVLLFLTPLLYHLPQAVLAAIIMMAVVGLLSVKSFIHAWRVQWYDGLIGIITFVCTLIFAPDLDRGIIIGVILSLLLYLIRNMKPDMAMLSLHPDGTYRNLKRFDLRQCPYVAVIRYAGSVIFSNVNYLENQVIETVRRMPELRNLILVGNGINEVDASGVDSLSVLIDRLRVQGIKFSVSGLNDTVLDVFKRAGLTAKIGENNISRNAERAIENIWEEAHHNTDESKCPLRYRTFKPFLIAEESRKIIQEKNRSGKKNNTENTSD